MDTEFLVEEGGLHIGTSSSDTPLACIVKLAFEAAILVHSALQHWYIGLALRGHVHGFY